MKFSDLLGDARREARDAPDASGPAADGSTPPAGPPAAPDVTPPVDAWAPPAGAADPDPGPTAEAAIPHVEARSGLSRLADNFLEDMPVHVAEADDGPGAGLRPVDDDLLPSARRR